jgi:hypothetical protein
LYANEEGIFFVYRVAFFNVTSSEIGRLVGSNRTAVHPGDRGFDPPGDAERCPFKIVK